MFKFTTAQMLTEPRFHACAACATVRPELVTKVKQIAKDKEGNAFWVETMRRNVAKRQGTRRACTPKLMLELERAGQRLERDGGDNYALALVTAQILNRVYQAEEHGDDCYKKYFPKVKKTGKIKNINFKSEFFCQHEKDDHVPVLRTENSFVRSKIRTCGKAWSCPICAAKIAVRRNAEVVTILKKARAEGMETYMITLTAPHYCGQRLLTVSSRMQAAYEHFDESKRIRHFKKDYNIFGKIKTMETMVGGKNGWHNHFHVVFIFDRKMNKEDDIIILDIIKKQWFESCIFAEILDVKNEKQVAAFREYSVSLKRDFDPEYIAKQSDEWKKEHNVSENWTAAEEMTFSHIKKGHGSFTMFGYIAYIARLARAGLLTNAEAERAAELYIEYCCAMKGRSMIQCSKGLKQWAGLKEKTDKKICNEQKDHGKIIGGFDKEQHVFVRNHALWKPFKKLLVSDQELAIKTINVIFKENGLRPFYGVAEMERLIYQGINDDFPEFNDPAPAVETPPKLVKSEIGEVRPKIEQLSLFAA